MGELCRDTSGKNKEELSTRRPFEKQIENGLPLGRGGFRWRMVEVVKDGAE